MSPRSTPREEELIWCSVSREWEGQTCAILAGGSSLAGFDISRLHDVRTITINDSWKMHPTAAIHYFADRAWFEDQWKRNEHSLDGTIDFRTLVLTGVWIQGVNAPADYVENFRINHLKFTGQLHLETSPAYLKHGSNSGYAAINLAYHLGVRRVLLLGYDMHARGTHSHWHTGPRMPRYKVHSDLTHQMLPCFPFLVRPLAEAGVEVINCTPGSALTCWPNMLLEEALRL